jgi:phytoene synthase
MTVFYAFCRVIDDIADAPNLETEVKRVRLTNWRQWLRQPGPGEPSLAGELRAVTAKYSIPPEMLDEIIAGVEMDLIRSRYGTFDELRVYCYGVASAVGLVSIEIFGYRNPITKQYAVELGLALQTTNIIRDVGRDLKSGRIYLPEEDLARFGYTEADLEARVYDERFLSLMKFEAARAHGFFDKAAELLPREDRRSMVAAEIMGSVYRGLLKRMEADNFQVFTKEYRLNKLQKAGRIAGQLLKFF